MQVVAFDLDGTLADSLDSIIAALNETLDIYKLQNWNALQIRPIIGTGARELLKFAFPNNYHEQLDEILKVYTPILQKHTQIVKPFPGIFDLIQLLNQKGITTAVCSNKPEAAAVSFVNSQNIPVADVIGVTEKIKPKPEPDMINVLKVKYNTDKVLMIGDTEVDYQTAVNANIDYILVSFGFRTKEELQKLTSTNIVDSVGQLKEKIIQMLNL